MPVTAFIYVLIYLIGLVYLLLTGFLSLRFDYLNPPTIEKSPKFPLASCVARDNVNNMTPS